MEGVKSLSLAVLGWKGFLMELGLFLLALGSQEDVPAQLRVPQFALKVSSGTFQFNLSPPFFFFLFYHVELGSLGEFSHFF